MSNALLNGVTITGADDATDINEIVRLSREYPFVEWGILVFKSTIKPSIRFPSWEWCREFASAAIKNGLNVSTHLCGEWVRELLGGKIDWTELPDVLAVSRRAQINTHGVPHAAVLRSIESLRIGSTYVIRGGLRHDREFIVQFDGVNDLFAYAAKDHYINVSALFDGSHGAGKLPEHWPVAAVPFPCGYAGGLGPENVIQQLSYITRVCPRPFWIDMETKVRTNDGLDLDAVEKVLSLTQPFVMKEVSS